MMQIDLATLPGRMQRLARDPQRQVPVPWFVLWLDGKPEFRIMDQEKFARAIKDRRCWVCGETLGRHLAFVVGPMCCVNRTSAEPPCHLECAVWSAMNCPFLSRPHMVRRETGLPDEIRKGEAHLDRNPGCTAVWVTRSYEVFKADGASASGYLMEMGDPVNVEWYTEGRPSTCAEVETSIVGGLPTLEAQCEQESTRDQRDEARVMLAKAVRDVQRWLPADTGGAAEAR